MIKKLSKDLKISRAELNYMGEFTRAYPIGRPAGELPWAHYETLLSVNNPGKHDALYRHTCFV